MPINKKGNALYPPYTKEELDQFLADRKRDYYMQLMKDNQILSFENEKLKSRNSFLENLINMTQELWHKGELFSIKELLACLKSGKITEKYQSLLDG